MSKMARKSWGGEYETKANWPENCFVQCGDRGLVLSKNGNYRTAFFEACPDNIPADGYPDGLGTFLRGEGESIEEAEQACFIKYEKIG